MAVTWGLKQCFGVVSRRVTYRGWSVFPYAEHLKISKVNSVNWVQIYHPHAVLSTCTEGDLLALSFTLVALRSVILWNIWAAISWQSSLCEGCSSSENILVFVSLNTCCLKLNWSKTFGLLWLEENALQCLSWIDSSLLLISCYISVATIKNKKPKANPEKFVTLNWSSARK